MNVFTVYQIKNTINNKIYVGVHKTKNPNDSYLGSGLHIKRAIQKYGKESFTKSILFEYNNSIDAYLKESQIVNNDFIKRTDTYNLMLGGFGSGGNSKISRAKMSKSTKGDKHPNFKGYYITPWGKLDSVTKSIRNWCKKYPDKVITRYSISKSKYLQSLLEDPNGKTFRELGFSFEPV